MPTAAGTEREVLPMTLEAQVSIAREAGHKYTDTETQDAHSRGPDNIFTAHVAPLDFYLI